MELHRVISVFNRCDGGLVCNRKGVCKMKNKKEQSKNNRSFVIGKSSMTITRKSIKIQSPQVIITGDVIQARKEN